MYIFIFMKHVQFKRVYMDNNELIIHQNKMYNRKGHFKYEITSYLSLIVIILT